METCKLDLLGGGSHSFQAPFVQGVAENPVEARKVPYRMRVDTGADISVVPTKLAKRLWLTPDASLGKFEYCGPNGQTLQLSIYRLNFAIAGLPPMSDIHAVAMDVPYVLIGVWTCLEKFRVDCDFTLPSLPIR